MMDAEAVLYVGAGVAMPTLLQLGARHGLPIPAYVTAAHAKAMSVLDTAGYTASDAQASSRFLSYNRSLVASRGAASATKPHLAKLTASEVRKLADAFLTATRTGVLVDGSERYEITPGENVRLGFTGGLVDLRAAIWEKLETADGRELTDLGNAAARVMRAVDGFASGFFSSDEDILSANLAVGFLANEMDAQGYLITGKPEMVSLAGGFAAAGDAVVAFGRDVSVDAGRKVLDAVWTAVKDNPLVMGAALLVGGLVVWRITRVVV